MRKTGNFKSGRIAHFPLKMAGFEKNKDFFRKNTKSSCRRGYQLLNYTLFYKVLYFKEIIMNKEDSNQVETKDLNPVADDIKYMRSVVERMSRQIKPDVHIMAACGLISMIAYAILYFFKTRQFDKWIWPVGLSVTTVLFIYVFVSLVRITKGEKKTGFISHLKKQVTWVWIFIMLHGLAWTISPVLSNNFCGGDPAFLWAMLFSIGLVVLGIFHSKEWLFGGIGIFAVMVLTYFMGTIGYLILGLAIGAGLIIPAIIVQRNFRKQEKENEQV